MCLATSSVSPTLRLFTISLLQREASRSPITLQTRPISNKIRAQIGAHNLKEVKSVLKANPGLLNKRVHGDTPLHCVAGGYSRQLRPVLAEPPKKLIKFIVSGTKDLDSTNLDGETALHIAARKAYSAVAVELLKHKANPAPFNCDGRTPFHVAITSMEAFDPSFRIEKMLLKKDPEVLEYADFYGNTPLFSLMGSVPRLTSQFGMDTVKRHYFENVYISNMESRIRFLLASGSSTRERSPYIYRTAADFMVRRLDPLPNSSCHRKRYEDLAFRAVLSEVAKHCELYQRSDQNGWTLLHWAAYVQSEELVKHLLSIYYKETPSHNGLTPGHLAIMNLNERIATMLMGEIDFAQVTPKYIAELVMRLPTKRIQCGALEKKPSILDSSIVKHYTTGICSNAGNSKLERVLKEMYHPDIGISVKSKMAGLIQTRDLSSIKALLEMGWNAMIDNDYVFDHYMLCSADKLYTVSHALDELVAEQDYAFHQDVLYELINSPTSGYVYRMRYKGYIGIVQFNDEAMIFHGEIVGLRDSITFRGATSEELVKEFERSVDGYIDWCHELGQEPEKSL